MADLETAHATLDHSGLTGVGGSSLDSLLTASSGEDIADALSGAAAPDAGNVFATMADVGGGGGGGGGLVLLEQHTASGSASLDFTTCISSTYDEYQIEIVGLVPATNAVNLWMRMSTDGGSTYDTSGVYSYDAFVFRAGGVGSAGTSGAAQIVLDYDGGGDSINNGTPGLAGVSGSYRLFAPGHTTLFKQVVGDISYRDASFRVRNMVRAGYESATAVDAFRFRFSSGNITSGVIRVYGIAKT